MGSRSGQPAVPDTHIQVLRTADKGRGGGAAGGNMPVLPLCFSGRPESGAIRIHASVRHVSAHGVGNVEHQHIGVRDCYVEADISATDGCIQKHFICRMGDPH